MLDLAYCINVSLYGGKLMSEIELMTVEEVSTFLKLGVPTIREMIKRGDIPAAKIGRQYRINRADIERLATPKTFEPTCVIE